MTIFSNVVSHLLPNIVLSNIHLLRHTVNLICKEVSCLLTTCKWYTIRDETRDPYVSTCFWLCKERKYLDIRSSCSLLFCYLSYLCILYVDWILYRRPLFFSFSFDLPNSFSIKRQNSSYLSLLLILLN